MLWKMNFMKEYLPKKYLKDGNVYKYILINIIYVYIYYMCIYIYIISRFFFCFSNVAINIRFSATFFEKLNIFFVV